MKDQHTIPANQKPQFIIAGGGTGGHIFPAIAIANAIKALLPAAEILFVGATGKMEMEKVPQAGYEIKGLTIAGYNRSSLLKNVLLPFKVIKSFYEVAQIFKAYKPKAVIGVGGYSSFPVLKYAQQKGIPTFLHESNSFAGKSNTLLARNATKVFTATDGMDKFFPAHKILVTGNPVRKSIVEHTATRELALNFFGFDDSKKTVLSIGGSLGAKSMNEAIAAALPAFEQHNLQLIWQTGKPFAEQAKALAAGYKNVYVSDFISQMEYAYTAADFVVSRSGAMAVAEICVAKKPVILVPYPFAAEDHQTVNAMALVNKDAAVMVRDNEAAQKLTQEIFTLANNEPYCDQLRKNIAMLAVTNADEVIAKSILSELNMHY